VYVNIENRVCAVSPTSRAFSYQFKKSDKRGSARGVLQFGLEIELRKSGIKGWVGLKILEKLS